MQRLVEVHTTKTIVMGRSAEDCSKRPGPNKSALNEKNPQDELDQFLNDIFPEILYLAKNYDKTFGVIY